jgi:branched-chain amino acid transport system permease protein
VAASNQGTKPLSQPPVLKVSIGGITGSPAASVFCAIALVALLFVPNVHNGYIENLFRGILMFGALSFGWNMIGGYTGYVSFGNVVFFGIGAYTTAILWQHAHQLNIALAVGCAMALCGFYALLFGLPILRLRGHYFGIATLGLSLATEEIITHFDWLGGGSGFPVRQLENFSLYYYAMWLVCAGCFLTTLAIARSKFGYALVAIRENEEAAAILGVNPTRYKVASWMISGAMAGATGAVYAGANGFIDGPTAFALDNNIFPIVMTLLGGIGTASGPLIGALILTAINETLWSRFPEVHTLFFGAVIVLVVLFLPRGLLWLVQVRGGWRGISDALRAYRV